MLRAITISGLAWLTRNSRGDLGHRLHNLPHDYGREVISEATKQRYISSYGPRMWRERWLTAAKANIKGQLDWALVNQLQISRNWFKFFLENPDRTKDEIFVIFTKEQVELYAKFADVCCLDPIAVADDWSFNLNVDSYSPRLKWAILKFKDGWKEEYEKALKLDQNVPDYIVKRMEMTSGDQVDA